MTQLTTEHPGGYRPFKLRWAPADLVPRLASIGWRGAILRLIALVTLLIGLAPSQAIRGVADDTFMPHWRLDGLDSLLGGGWVPSAGLQRILSEPGTEQTLIDLTSTFVYLAWLPVCWAVMAYVIIIRWDSYRRFALSWFGIWYVALIAFVVLPVEPPWVLESVERTLVEGSAGFVNADPNPTAAFPSLHVGLPATLAFQARAAGIRTLSRPLFIFTALTAFAVVHLGEHYVIDALGGVGVAWLTVKLVERIAVRSPGYGGASRARATRRLTGVVPGRAQPPSRAA